MVSGKNGVLCTQKEQQDKTQGFLEPPIATTSSSTLSVSEIFWRLYDEAAFFPAPVLQLLILSATSLVTALVKCLNNCRFKMNTIIVSSFVC